MPITCRSIEVCEFSSFVDIPEATLYRVNFCMNFFQFSVRIPFKGAGCLSIQISYAMLLTTMYTTCSANSALRMT